MNITPVGRKILVRPIPKKEEKLDSGIILPENAMADLREAEVVVVSKEIEHLYKPGDIILKPEKKGVGQMVNGEIYLWVDTRPELEEVWGIVIPEKVAEDKQDNL